MLESALIILSLFMIYSPSPSYFVALLLALALYIYNYWLALVAANSVSALILFLNKLNSATLNPLLLLIAVLWVLMSRYYTFRAVKARGPLSFMLLLLVFCSGSLVENLLAANVVYVKIAPTLTNGLLIIHPLMLYTFYGLVLYVYVLSASCNFGIKQASGFLSPYVSIFTKAPIYLSGSVALGLGSWWSYQELNWGGFWSWDLVEIFLLVTVIYTLLKQHVQIETCKNYWYVLLFFFNFSLYVFSVRYNLINSIHNFISQAEFVYKITYLLVIYLLLSVVILYKSRGSQLFSLNSKVYYYPLLFLGGLYVTLLIYVVFSYLAFYVFSSSPTTLIVAVPLVVNTLWLAKLLPLLSLSSLILPLSDSLLWRLFWSWQFGKGFVWWLHLVIFVSLSSLLLWYGIVLLAPLSNHNLLLPSLSWCTPAQTYQLVLQWLTIRSSNASASTHLYLDTANSLSIVTSTFDLVVYATTYFFTSLSYIIFSHKFFCKISFVEGLLLLLALGWYTYKRESMKRTTLEF